MLKHELEHIIRAASAITNQYEIIVVGSQSILGSVDSPPQECLESIEADIIIPGNERLSDLIDGAIGEGSPFQDSFGYYAQGVDSTTCMLPAGWQDRLVRLQSQNTDGKIGFCLDVTDLFLAKCAANREKDREFNRALLIHGIVDEKAAQERVASMPVDEPAKKRIENLIARLASEARTPVQTLQTESAKLALIAELQTQGVEIRKVEDRTMYLGQIKRVTDKFVVQGLGRNAVVIHDLAQLDGSFVAGQNAEIKYADGRGHDCLQGLERRQNDHPGCGL
ncbi:MULTISPECIES: DUF6036 family nucleotidyltransferase [unclassified Polaromonas]|uniref:KfrB domain-containing protein n=1 Tax=unclassified Polaromonas TaxID=2638319 RepID=UPI0025D8FE3E|nr:MULTISPECIES: DUF6036 family nucleotidyltransferase [unclassified Polaromonas]